jgi:hypothetical protein
MSELENVDLFRFRCADCTYGASAVKPPRQCPMCGGTRWQREEWRALERLPADLRRYRPPAEVSVPAGGELENGQSARLAFRNLNEKIRWLQLRGADERLDLVCECDDPQCFAPFSIDLADYENLRADPEQFLVLPGHEPPSSAEVVEVGPRYVIVRVEASPAPSTSEAATTVEERERTSALLRESASPSRR